MLKFYVAKDWQDFWAVVQPHSNPDSAHTVASLHPSRKDAVAKCALLNAGVKDVPFVDVGYETAYGSTQRFSRAIRVF